MTTFIKSNAVKAAVGLLAILALGVAYSANAAYTFTQNLKMGQSSAEVVEVQKFLNSHGYTVATSGAGSAGMESTYYGAKSVAAAKLFQAAQGLPSTGYWGPMSRAAANALGAGTQTGGTLPPGCTPGALFSTTTGQPCTTGGNTQTQTGPVTASLSATNPASGVIIQSQASARLLDITFTGNGTVNSVQLTRTGISTQSTLDAVYLYDGVQRLTDGYSFNSMSQMTINNLGLQVSGSRTISVVADVGNSTNAPSGQTIAVALTSFTAGTTATTVTVQGNVMSVANGTGTLAGISYVGSNTVTGTPTVNAGTTSYAVWRQAFQVNTRPVWLKAANFRITGSAPSDALANAKLYVDGVQVGGVASMTMANGSNYLSFNLMSAPASLNTGSHTLEVRADVVKGSSFSFTVSLQQASDLMVYDPQIGVNLAIGSFSASTGATITIGTGSVTVVIDPAFNSMTNVTGGSSNAVIGKFKVHGYGEDVKVTSITATPSVTNACTSGSTYGVAPCNVSGTTQFASGNGLQNVTLYFNGSQVGSQTPTWTSGAITFNLGSQMIIPAGVDSTIEVRADLRTTTGVNYTAGTVSASLGAGTGEGWNSHASVTTPTSSGHSLTVQTGLLGVSKNIGYADQSQNPNTAGVKIGSYVLQNQSSSESVRVTSLTVGLTQGDGATVLTNTADVSVCPGTTPFANCYPALTNFSGLRTSETSGSGSTPVQPQGSNVFSVDFTLAPGATKVIDIFADTGSSNGSFKTTLAVTALGSSSNTSISVAATPGQTITLSAGTVGTPTILSASSTSAQYIAAGGTGAADATKATFNFVSTGGAATISELKFTVAGTGTVTQVSVGGVSAPVVGTVAWLQGLNLAVPNGGAGLTVDVLVSYAPVGTSGIAPGTTSTVSLTYVKYTSGGTTATLTPSVAAPQMTMVGSKPTVSVNSTQSLGLILGAENKIGEVTVAADAKGNIKINDIKFSVGSSNISTFAITSPRIADGSTTITGSSCGADAATTTTIFCEFADAGATATGTQITDTESNTDFDGYTIAAGTPKTFSLYGTVGGTIASAGGVTTVSTSVAKAGFNWDDTSTNGASGKGLTGTLIYGFPTGSYSIKQ